MDEGARRRPRDHAQAPRNGDHGRRHAAADARREGEGRDVQHEQGRAHRVHPPRTKPPHDQLGIAHRAGRPHETPGEGQRPRLGPEQPPHAPLVEAEGAQGADLAQALLDPEAEEEARQQQGRHHQEEAEVGEVLAEVGHPGRRLEGEVAGRIDDEPGRKGIESGPERVAERRRREVRDPVRGNDPQRGHLSPPRPPQPLAVLEGDEPLRRGAVLVPVVLVLRADEAEVDGERRVPVGQVRGLGDAGVLGREVLVGGQPLHRHHPGHPELGLVEEQLAAHPTRCLGVVDAESPPRNIDLVRTVIAGIAGPEVPVPVPLVVETVLVEGNPGRRAEPSVIVDSLRNGRVLLVADVVTQLDIPSLCHDNVADLAGLDDLYRLECRRPTAGLRSDLNNAFIPTGGVHHQSSFAYVVRGRLLNIDVLARITGEYRRRGMPVIGSRDDNRVNFRVVEQTPHIIRRLRLRLTDWTIT